MSSLAGGGILEGFREEVMIVKLGLWSSSPGGGNSAHTKAWRWEKLRLAQDPFSFLA